jgi:hypothetical protein
MVSGKKVRNAGRNNPSAVVAIIDLLLDKSSRLEIMRIDRASLK